MAVILAGGKGTRLSPLTKVANKHLLPVYDKPMIYYPIETLKHLGHREIVIVSGGENIGGFADLLEDGKELGVELTYRIQPKASGIAGALLCAEGLVKGTFPVILGDNYFETPPQLLKPGIVVKKVENPNRFGVYSEGSIIEKPNNPQSDLAVTGYYMVDDNVFGFIRTQEPSARGELEITDVNNWYLSQGGDILEYSDYWSDMGTFDSLNATANFIKGNQ